jgi:hypothetical protein
VPRMVENLSVALMGSFAGGCLFVSTVLVPAWRRMGPEEVLEWFARNELRSGLTLSPLEVAGALTAAVSFVRAMREESDGRLAWALSVLCMLATIAQLPLYFARTNRAIVQKKIPHSRVGPELESWSKWQWARTSLAVLAVVFGIRGMHRETSCPIATDNRR